MAFESQRAAGPLVVSLAVHGALVTALFTLSFSRGITEPPLRTRATILLAPAPLEVRLAAPVLQEAPRTVAPTLRRFLAPAIISIEKPHEATPAAPLFETPRAVLPTLSVRPIAVAPPPPLRTDNLTAPATVVPALGIVRLAGFTAAAPAAAAQAGAQRVSGFESVAAADRLLPRQSPALSHSGFGDASVVDSQVETVGGSAHAASLALTRPVEILIKPKPAYTEEARRLHIEGEVLLDILFSASGQVRILSTVRGLGHGLDESATAAAEAIRFRPAERAGVAIDSTAVVHIVFQLAY